MKTERTFIGTTHLEDILITLLKSQIDSMVSAMYDDTRVNATPSTTEGTAEQ